MKNIKYFTTLIFTSIILSTFFLNCGGFTSMGGNTQASLSSSGSAASTVPKQGTFIANDFSEFMVTANSVVQYGADSSFVTKTLSGDSWCTANFFGEDPSPGVTKACYLVSGSVVGPNPSPTPTVTPPAQAAGYKLVFKDDFDSLSLNKSQSAPYDDSTWFQGFPWDLDSNPGTFTIADSILTISSGKGDGTQLNSISRDNKFGHAWTYGYFEARLKWNVIEGNFPAFWLFSSEHAVGGDFENGVQHWCEIDIFEGQGHDPHTYYGTMHDWLNFNSAQNGNNQYTVPGDMNEYHTYGALWTPTQVTWYYDNTAVMSAPVPEICTRQKLELIIGAQRGGWSNAANTTAEVHTTVDWVHVFQK